LSKLPNKVKHEIIDRLDQYASKPKKIGLYKKTSQHYPRAKMHTGLGFVRTGKYALGRLSDKQRKIMVNVKKEFIKEVEKVEALDRANVIANFNAKSLKTVQQNIYMLKRVFGFNKAQAKVAYDKFSLQRPNL